MRYALIFIIVVSLFFCSVSFGDLPEGAIARLGKGCIYDVALSSDGSKLAVSTSIGVYIIDPTTFEIIRQPDGNMIGSTISLNSDGTILALDHLSNAIDLLDLNNNNLIKTIQSNVGMGIYSVCFSPDGKLIACGAGDNQPRLFDVELGKQIAALGGHSKTVYYVCFSPDGKLLASGSQDLTIKLWDVEKQENVATLRGHTWYISSLVFSSDGKFLASAGRDGYAKIWDLATMKEIANLGVHFMGAYSVALSPSNDLLAVGTGDGKVKLWDMKTYQEVATLEGHSNSVEWVFFTNEGKNLISASYGGELLLWDVEKRQIINKMDGYTNPTLSVAFSPDDRLLASSNSEGMVYLWDAKDTNNVSTMKHTRWANCVCFSPDGKTLFSGSTSGTIMLCDVEKRNVIDIISTYSGSIYSLATTSDGKTIAIGSNTVKLWDIVNCKEIAELEGHTNYIESVAFSPDNRHLASGSWDNTIKIWDTSTYKSVASLKGHTYVAKSVAYSPDGSMLASGSWDGTARLWDMKTYKEIAILDDENKNPIWAIAFDPKGNMLAVGHHNGTADLWDIESRKVIGTFSRHYSEIRSLCFSHDGKILATSGWDATILLWDMTKYNALYKSKFVNPDDKLIATWGKVKNQLYQNYPNPFNPETWIPYELAKEGEISINIYDTQGKLIRNLDLGYEKAGFHKAQWDGMDNNAQSAVSGVYFYMLKAGNFCDTKKMVILR